MGLAIQNWLRDFSICFPGQVELALAKLEADFAIKARRHGDRGNLVLLKYDQINSPFKEELVQDCRGIILDDERNWAVVCCTYRKFFNHGESLAAEIDWPSATVCEKLDGSLIQLYYYPELGWQVATSGTPDANCQINDFGTTFRELFWKTWHDMGLTTDGLNTQFCYAFELCSPINRVVVQHETAKLVLHGVRNLHTMAEEHPEAHAYSIGVPTPRVFDYQTAFEAQQGAMHIDPLKQEGYVARDQYFRRVKIKSPSYVALHHAKDGLLSRRMIANTIRKGESEELRTALEAFPELSEQFEKLRAAHRDLVRGAEVVFRDLTAELPSGFSRKDFALKAKQYPLLSGVLFHLLDLKPDAQGLVLSDEAAARIYFANLHEKAYGRLVGIKE